MSSRGGKKGIAQVVHFFVIERRINGWELVVSILRSEQFLKRHGRTILKNYPSRFRSTLSTPARACSSDTSADGAQPARKRMR